MVPKLHAKGASFKGAAAYLLHDKGCAVTSERVEWIETRNLATGDGRVAWKVMAATAMDADRLKRQAGVKNTGRKSTDAVLHFSLSWHPDEQEGLSRDEMRRAALGAIRALGADDRQAMLICHNDEKQPHLHVVVNRISAQDGRMLSSSKEKLNLSRWAQDYERHRGQIYCENRVLNNGARDRDEYTRGKKDQARHLYEAEQKMRPTEQVKNEQRQKDAAVAKQMRETRTRHRQKWREIERHYGDRLKAIRTISEREIMMAKTAIRDRYRPEWRQLHYDHEAERRAFMEQEKSLFGRLTNALRAIDFAALVGRQSRKPEQRQTLGQVFTAISTAGARLKALRHRQDQQSRGLQSQQKGEEKRETIQIRIGRDRLLTQERSRFEQERNDLVLIQKLEAGKVRADWKTRGEQRAKAWEKCWPIPGGWDRSRELERKLQIIEQFRARGEKKNEHERDR